MCDPNPNMYSIVYIRGSLSIWLNALTWSHLESHTRGSLGVCECPTLDRPGWTTRFNNNNKTSLPMLFLLCTNQQSEEELVFMLCYEKLLHTTCNISIMIKIKIVRTFLYYFISPHIQTVKKKEEKKYSSICKYVVYDSVCYIYHTYIHILMLSAGGQESNWRQHINIFHFKLQLSRNIS